MRESKKSEGGGGLLKPPQDRIGLKVLLNVQARVQEFVKAESVFFLFFFAFQFFRGGGPAQKIAEK